MLQLLLGELTLHDSGHKNVLKHKLNSSETMELKRILEIQ